MNESKTINAKQFRGRWTLGRFYGVKMELNGSTWSQHNTKPANMEAKPAQMEPKAPKMYPKAMNKKNGKDANTRFGPDRLSSGFMLSNDRFAIQNRCQKSMPKQVAKTIMTIVKHFF